MIQRELSMLAWWCLPSMQVQLITFECCLCLARCLDINLSRMQRLGCTAENPNLRWITLP